MVVNGVCIHMQTQQPCTVRPPPTVAPTFPPSTPPTEGCSQVDACCGCFGGCTTSVTGGVCFYNGAGARCPAAVLTRHNSAVCRAVTAAVRPAGRSDGAPCDNCSDEHRVDTHVNVLRRVHAGDFVLR
eukprot:gene47048-37257_t